MNNILVIIFFILFSTSYSQEPGIDKPEWDNDSTIIFKSPRPLYDPTKSIEALKYSVGADFAFSNHGFGLGIYWSTKINSNYDFLINLMISGARASDELEFIDWDSGRYLVPNKINRLMMFPTSFGVKRYLMQESFEGNLLPYVSGGVSLNSIISTPYLENWVALDEYNVRGDYVPYFRSFSETSYYFRVGGFLEAGFDFYPFPKQRSSINLRYYYIPFGEQGLESIYGLPLKNFGGLFISFSLGVKY